MTYLELSTDGENAMCCPMCGVNSSPGIWFPGTEDETPDYCADCYKMLGREKEA